MRQIQVLIAALLLLLSIPTLQSQENGNVSRTISNILTQLPADNREDYQKQLDAILSTGEEGIITLVKMLRAPGQGDNTKVEYALSGITNYVSGKADQSLSNTITGGYIKALALSEEREIKAFIISQLQIAGKDESVDPLARYLTEESLSDPAARALASIGSPKASEALKSALLRKVGTPAARSNIIFALGETNNSGAETILNDIIAEGDEDTKKAVFYALSQVGSATSLSILSSAAEKAKLSWDNTSANEAYIALLHRLVKNGDTKEATKAASDLLRKATKAGATHTRIAALQVLLSIEKSNGLKRVQKAMRDTSRQYRVAALANTSDFATRYVYVELLKTMAKSKPEAKADILNWIEYESRTPEKNALIKTLDIRFDQTAGQLILEQLKSKDSTVRQSAVWALVRIGDVSFIPTLVNLLASPVVSDIQLGRDALIAFRGDIESEVSHVIPTATDPGKIAAVEILAVRKSHTRINNVLDLIKTGAPEVKQAAYAALKDLSTEKDLTLLCGMLESSGATAVPFLQNAVIASISSLSAGEQSALISRRMLQAGEKAKHLYYVVLSATGDREALSTIVTGFRQSVGEAKDAAFEALLSWKGSESTDELYAICEDVSAPTYFDRALAAYTRAVPSDSNLTADERYLGLRKAIEIAKTNDQRATVLRQIGRTGSYQALLYAGSLLDDKQVQRAAADAVINIALNNKTYSGTEVIELLNKVSSILTDHGAEYQRESIRKHIEEISKDAS
jgi:HEAT repeat protein